MKTKSLYKTIIKSNCSSNNSYVIYLILPKIKNSYNLFLINYNRFILEYFFIFKAPYKFKNFYNIFPKFKNSSSLTDSNSLFND